MESSPASSRAVDLAETRQFKIVMEGVLRIPTGLSMRQRIARGEYHRVDPLIRRRPFRTTVPCRYDGHTWIRHAVVDVPFKVFLYECYIKSLRQVRLDIGREGCSPGTLAELLVLGETHPELQLMFPIPASGVVSGAGMLDDPFMIPVLCKSEEGDRELHLVQLLICWAPGNGFLGVDRPF